MNFNIGDKVIVINHPINKFCSLGSSKCPFMNSSMKIFIGKTASVIRFHEKGYYLNFPNQSWCWGDCMLKKATDIKADIEESTCTNCNNKLSEDDSYRDPNDNTLCCDCYSDQCIMCEDCNDIVWTDDARQVNDTWYGDCCIWDHAFQCNGCSGLFNRNDQYNCENCDNNYCESCQENDSCRREQEQSQNIDFQTGKKSKLITVDRFVGVEIEAEHGERSNLDLPDTFGIKDDGSLDDSGVEVVTPPSKDGALVENIKLACQQLDNAGFEPTDHCGLHIHIDLRDIKDNFIKLSRILRTFYAVEDVLYAMLPDSRLHNDYCYPLRNYYRFYDFYGRKITKEFDATLYGEKNKARLAEYKRNHHSDKRYRSCNFHSVFYRGTLEVRLHSASQNPTKILNWIELLLKITDWSINHYKHSTIESLLKLDATKEKVHRMQKVFKFSKKIETYINQRIKEFNHQNLHINYTLGELPKRTKKWTDPHPCKESK